MKKATGVDIGTDSIKLIELEDKKTHLEVTKCTLKQVVNGDVKLALKQVLDLAKLSSKKVNISLSGPSVIVRYIEMPPMKEEELEGAVKFEAEKYMPFSVGEAIIDCAVLDKSASGQQRVLVVGAKKNEVDKLLQLFKELGLEVSVIDVDSFAILNSFQRFGIEGKEETTYALLNLGDRFSNMNIIAKKNAYFTRDILWGGRNVTARIKDMMGCPLQEAEQLKQNPSDKKEQLINTITPILEKLASQIGMSFDYFESQFGKSVESLYISGGSSYLFNITEFLKNSLEIDVKMWDPFQRLKIGESVLDQYIKSTPSIFSVAVGLALRK